MSETKIKTNFIHQPGNYKEEVEIPQDLPLLPVTNTIVFPYVVAPLVITDERNMAMVN